MKNSVVILCSSSNDAYWAVDYYQNYPDEKVLILVSNIEGQLILKINNIDYLKLFEVENFEVKDSSHKENNIYINSLNIIRALKNEYSHRGLRIYSHNLFDMFLVNLTYIYTDILHSYKIFQNILKKWQPIKIYVPDYTHESYINRSKEDFCSLAYYIRYYFKSVDLKVEVYKTVSKRTSIIGEIVTSFKQKSPLLKYFLQKIYYSINNKKTVPFFENKSTKKTILMETGGIITSYYYNLFPLLAKKFNFILITYKLQLSQQIPLMRRRIPFENLNSFWKLEFIRELNIQKKRLLNKIHKLCQTTLERKSPALNNIPLRKAFIELTYLFLLKNLENILMKVILSRELLKRFQPKVVINSHDPSPTGLSLVLPAKKVGIPTILLLHGFPMGEYQLESSSDYLITWGKECRVYYLKQSQMAQQNVLCSGFPPLDRYLEELKNITSNKKNNGQRLSELLKIGILLTSYHPNDSYISKFIHEFFKESANLKIRTVCNYRFHEGFAIKGIEKLAEVYGIKTNNQSLQTIDEFIAANDIIICWDTTAIIWAMLHRKPLFHTTPNWSTPLIPTKKYNAAWIPKNAYDLIKKINNFIDNPEIYLKLLSGQRVFLEDFVGPLDGKSSQRLANFIDKLTQILSK